MGEEIFSKELSTFKKEINFISNLYVNKKMQRKKWKVVKGLHIYHL